MKVLIVFFFLGYGDHRDLHVLTHSFPTRRSSDLKAANLRADGYMLGLSGPGHAALRMMGLLPALTPRNRRINENVYYGRDDKVLLRLRYHEFLKGLDWLTVARTDLVEVLHEATRSRADIRRSEEHTSERQSLMRRSYAVLGLQK